MFGDGMFGKMNFVHFGGHRHCVVDVLWRTIKQKEYQGQVLAIRIDEFLTSRVNKNVCREYNIRSSFQLTMSVWICSIYDTRALNRVRTADNIGHHGIQSRNNCGILWQRDVNTGNNMFGITMILWRNDTRPLPFQRTPTAQPATTIITTTTNIAAQMLFHCAGEID
jgi:hypothetical protein